MELENAFANHVSAAGANASYDAACKRLLANKSILAWIMKSCIEEYRDAEIEEIVKKYIEGSPQISQAAVNPDEWLDGSGEILGTDTQDSTMQEGTVTYDIRFFAIAPNEEGAIQLIINVEAQNNFYPGYPILKRGIYYCSRMISSQYGTGFSGAKYGKIKKVYSIWICRNPPKNRANSITRYSVQEENLVGNVKEKKENYDLITVVMICLGDENRENYNGILKLLDVLLSSEKEAEEKKKILKEDFHIKMTETLEREVSIMCNLSKGVEEKGIQKGIKEGIKEGIITAIENLMDSMGWTAEQAMTALKVPESEWLQYVSLLKK